MRILCERVRPETATAPAGWQERLVGVRVPMRPGSGETATGWCIEAHDLVVAKCVAGREKDRRFAEEAVGHRLVDPDELLRRVADLPLPLDDRRRVEATVRGVVRRAGSSPPE